MVIEPSSCLLRLTHSHMRSKQKMYTRTFGMTKTCSIIATIQRAHHIIAILIRCMIKIFWGGRGDDTFETPSPYEQLLPLPTPCFKMFLEDPLMTPTPHHPTSSIFHCYPYPIHHPSPPPKNFDHTQKSHRKVQR